MPEDEAAWNTYFSKIKPLHPLKKNKNYTLRVLKINDSRLPDLTENQYQTLYRQIEIFTEKYIGFKVKLVDAGKKDILDFFSSYNTLFQKSRFRYRIGSGILHLNNITEWSMLENSIMKNIKDRKLKTIQNYLPDGKKAQTFEEAGQLMFDAFREKFNAIRSIRVKDDALFKEGNYALTQDYLYWTSILYEASDADIYITNSMIFSADDAMPPYVIKRGGITSAVTDNNIYNELQGAIVLGLYQFISTNEIIARDRGELPEEELENVIALLMTHEMGHLMGRYDEYYDLKHSVHVAPVDINYYQWYLNIVNYKSQIPKTFNTLTRF